MALTRGFLASTVLHGCAHLVQPHATREAEPTLEPAAAAALHESSSSYCGGASAHGDAECEGLHWHAHAHAGSATPCLGRSPLLAWRKRAAGGTSSASKSYFSSSNSGAMYHSVPASVLYGGASDMDTAIPKSQILTALLELIEIYSLINTANP
jgi:hypothetical protein